jgi:4-hydroxy-tetrahydrodipicolinate reductase
MTGVAIAGAAGRMGLCLVRCARSVPAIRLAGAVERPGHPALGEDTGCLAGGGDNGVRLSADLRAALVGADVLVDFTQRGAVPGNAALAVELGKAMVLGTTGLNDVEASAVRAAARRVPVVWAPNMSLGVNLLFAVLARAAEVLGPAYRVRIDETHHVHKKDAPSGTALRLGESVARGRGEDFGAVWLHDPGGAMSEYPEGRIAIRSHRDGEIVGDHTVAFENDGEVVSFSHRAKSRDAFALGALRAAQWAAGRPAGLYDMMDVLGLESVKV